ncbi:MAG TPA: GNAT family N-acetyltransferase [Candidatus Sulfotelmatobacter sp.]|nr:GNAT family N-acetyltransferase [Candidatus Sulfotelmatobacter sp.]
MTETTEKYLLKSERLGFRWWTADDLPLAQQLWGDLEVTKYFGGPFSEDDVRKRFKRERARRMVHGYQYWVIELLKTGEFVGVCGLQPNRPAEDIIELGFHLLPRFWGQGLATEAARVVIRYAFEKYSAKKLVAGHHPENVMSKKVLDKLGFQYSHDEKLPGIEVDIPRYILEGTDGES